MKFNCYCGNLTVKSSNDDNHIVGSILSKNQKSWDFKHCFTTKLNEKDLSKRKKWLIKNIKGKYILAGCHSKEWKIAFDNGADALKYNLSFVEVDDLKLDYSEVDNLQNDDTLKHVVIKKNKKKEITS